MNIGEKIKELRTSKMMTQAELAGDQITRNMLSLIERGAATPSLQTVLYLASRLQVPPGFLLAEGVDEFSYRKMSRISNIRAAYRSGDYKSCRSICRQELDGTDDEISLILAECDTGIGEEEFLAGHLHSACRFFDEALEYADKTVYRTDYVRAVAALYFRYMNDFSHTLYSEVSDEEPGGGAIGENPICAYIRAYFAVREGNEEEVGAIWRAPGTVFLPATSAFAGCLPRRHTRKRSENWNACSGAIRRSRRYFCTISPHRWKSATGKPGITRALTIPHGARWSCLKNCWRMYHEKDSRRVCGGCFRAPRVSRAFHRMPGSAECGNRVFRRGPGRYRGS